MICVIIVNYKGYSDTISCVKSIIQSQHNPSFSVVVVDNNSGETDLLKIKETFNLQIDKRISLDLKYDVYSCSKSQIFLISSDTNGGFAYGNNLGIKLAMELGGYKYVWLLNNDTVVDKQAMSNLYHYHESLPDNVGILGNKLVFYDNHKCIQAIGGLYDKYLSRSKHIGAYEIDNGQYDKPDIKMDYIVGASMFVRMQFINDVGLMTEDYFLYFEELDWILRGRKKGWEIAFTPNAVVYHKEGGSTIQNSRGLKNEVADVCMIKNRILFTKRFYPKFLFTVYIGCIITIIRRFLQGHFSRARILLKALCV